MPGETEKKKVVCPECDAEVEYSRDAECPKCGLAVGAIYERHRANQALEKLREAAKKPKPGETPAKKPFNPFATE